MQFVDSSLTTPLISTEDVPCANVTRYQHAKRKLLCAICICLLFMVAEAVGGWLSGSLALFTDAAHLLSDVFSFVISLIALYIGTKRPSPVYNFGFYRAEILGALFSVFVIWMLTALLVYEAVFRILTRNVPPGRPGYWKVNGDQVLIVACIGLVVNLVLMKILGHSHHHGHGHGHTTDVEVDIEPEPEDFQSHGVHEGHGHSHMGGKAEDSINVQAAFIHALGDLLQSVGVIIAGSILHFLPEWKIIDPICTFVFSIIVLFTTTGIFRSTVHVLMEGTPADINSSRLRASLRRISGVMEVVDVRVWSLTIGVATASCKLAVIAKNSDVLCLHESVLYEANEVFHKIGIEDALIQIEYITEIPII